VLGPRPRRGMRPLPSRIPTRRPTPPIRPPPREKPRDCAPPSHDPIVPLSKHS
jgi:hypothetical protein